MLVAACSTFVRSCGFRVRSAMAGLPGNARGWPSAWRCAGRGRRARHRRLASGKALRPERPDAPMTCRTMAGVITEGQGAGKGVWYDVTTTINP